MDHLEIEKFKKENPHIYSLFKEAHENNSGLFVKLPTTKNLSSYSSANSTKARPVFIRYPIEIENQNLTFTIYERGTGPSCMEDRKHPKLKNISFEVWACKIETCDYVFKDTYKKYSLIHKPHECYHNRIIIDSKFGSKHKNVDRNTKKVLGPKNRCHGSVHYDISCSSSKCKKAALQYQQDLRSGLPRCELHNGNDCCGIDDDGQMFRSHEKLSKLLVLTRGSFCFSANDTLLKNETLKRVP